MQEVKASSVIEVLLRIAAFVTAVPHALAFAMFAGAVDRTDAFRAFAVLAAFAVLTFAPSRTLGGWLILLAALVVAAINAWEIVTDLGDASGVVWGAVSGLAIGLAWLVYLIRSRVKSQST
jgi:hypothetical protein